MKSACLTYHRVFPETPISRWVIPRSDAWKRNVFDDGSIAQPNCVRHPFRTSLKLWCRLDVEFQGIRLAFAVPEELDQFRDVMGSNPLPSGPRLVPGTRLGRPNRHWLSRLPAKAKSARFRRALLAYLDKSRQVDEFRAFYRRTPPTRHVEGLFAHKEEAGRP